MGLLIVQVNETFTWQKNELTKNEQTLLQVCLTPVH